MSFFKFDISVADIKKVLKSLKQDCHKTFQNLYRNGIRALNELIRPLKGIFKILKVSSIPSPMTIKAQRAKDKTV